MSEDLKLAFFVGSTGSIVSKVIAWFTRSKFSHVELVFDDDDPKKAECFSSKAHEGVRYKTIDLTSKSWVVVDLHASVSEYKAALNLADVLASKHIKYDYLADLNFVIPIGIRDKDGDRDFCSEIVSEVLEKSGYLKKVSINPWDIDPNDLYELVIANGTLVTYA